MNRIVPPLLLALTLGLGGYAAVAAPPRSGPRELAVLHPMGLRGIVAEATSSQQEIAQDPAAER